MAEELEYGRTRAGRGCWRRREIWKGYAGGGRGWEGGGGERGNESCVSRGRGVPHCCVCVRVCGINFGKFGFLMGN